jgi:hypothetical protein
MELIYFVERGKGKETPPILNTKGKEEYRNNLQLFIQNYMETDAFNRTKESAAYFQGDCGLLPAFFSPSSPVGSPR